MLDPTFTCPQFVTFSRVKTARCHLLTMLFPSWVPTLHAVQFQGPDIQFSGCDRFIYIKWCLNPAIQWSCTSNRKHTCSRAQSSCSLTNRTCGLQNTFLPSSAICPLSFSCQKNLCSNFFSCILPFLKHKPHEMLIFRWTMWHHVMI